MEEKNSFLCIPCFLFFWLSLAICRPLRMSSNENITLIFPLFTLLAKYTFLPNIYHNSLWQCLKAETFEYLYSRIEMSIVAAYFICSMHHWWMNSSLKKLHAADSVGEFHPVLALTLQDDLGIGFLEEMIFQWYFEYMKRKLKDKHMGDGGNYFSNISRITL